MSDTRKKTYIEEWAQTSFPDTFAALPSVDRMTFEGIELHDSYDWVKSSKVLWVGYHEDKASNATEKNKIYAYIIDRSNNVKFAVKDSNSGVSTILEWHAYQKIEFVYPFNEAHWGRNILRDPEPLLGALIRYYFEVAGHLKWGSVTSFSNFDQNFGNACACIASNTRTNTRSGPDGDEHDQAAEKGNPNEESRVAAQMNPQIEMIIRSNPNARTMVSTESQAVGAGSSFKRRKFQHDSPSDELDAKADTLFAQIKNLYSAEDHKRAQKTQKIADDNDRLRAQLKSAKESEVSTKGQLTVAKTEIEALRKRAEKAENIAADAEETTRKIREQVKQLGQL